MHDLVVKVKHLLSNTFYYWQYQRREKLYKQIKVLTIRESIELIVANKMSVARFGDGELRWAIGEQPGYFKQEVDDKFSLALQDVLINPAPNTAVGLQRSAFGHLEEVTSDNRKAWRYLMWKYGMRWLDIIPKDHIYVDTNLSRLYIDRENKDEAKDNYQLLKSIWANRNVLMVEGMHTKFGVGNNLLENVASIRRIEGPSENAFSKYSELLNAVKMYARKDDLILIALGPTATILANDLAKDGIQAIDIGHADIEYEWFLKQVSTRVGVDGKHVEESKDKVNDTESNELDDELFKSEVIAEI
jgi:glycosyltransferase family protein